MNTHDQTLYVTTQGAYVGRKGQCLNVRANQQTLLTCPVHTFNSLVCFGNVTVSPFAMDLCAQSNVTISFLSKYGRFLARVTGPQSGNVLLRRQQYRISDDTNGQCANIARAIVAAKIANCRTSLLRVMRDHPDETDQDGLTTACRMLASILNGLQNTSSLDEVRGAEGQAARYYFGVFNHLICYDGKGFVFNGRSRRPPMDNVNALLSFVYTLLVHDIRSACESVGLDPQVGFLHCERPGRPSLALDLMEELRPALADRFVLTLINRRQIQPQGFRKSESGAVEMSDKTRKTVITAWQKRKADQIAHPFLQDKMTLGLIPHAQAKLLARHLRGDLDAYPAFFWK